MVQVAVILVDDSLEQFMVMCKKQTVKQRSCIMKTKKRSTFTCAINESTASETLPKTQRSDCLQLEKK